MWYSIVFYLILKHRVAPDCWLSAYVITSYVMQWWLWHDCSSVLTPTFSYFFPNYTVWNLRFCCEFLNEKSPVFAFFDCRWLSHLSDINKCLIGANAILYSWHKAATGIFSILYIAFGTSIVLKMPACPDRIRIRAQIMNLFLIFQNICKFIKTAVIAVIFQNSRWTRSRKPQISRLSAV